MLIVNMLQFRFLQNHFASAIDRSAPISLKILGNFDDFGICNCGKAFSTQVRLIFCLVVLPSVGQFAQGTPSDGFSPYGLNTRRHQSSFCH